MERWTNSDEAALQRMLQRKVELIEKNMKPLIAIVKREDFQHMGNEEIAQAMADNADAFRDALEPFDSGFRCVPDSTPANA